MSLEKKAKKKRLFQKCAVIFLTVVVMISMCSMTAFAEGLVTETPTDGEDAWTFPGLSQIYQAIRTILFSMVQLFMSCAFILLDKGTVYANKQLAYTPSNYGGDYGIGAKVFPFVDSVAEKVILPIATILLTYIVIYEFITMIVDKNNFHDFDTSIFSDG